MNISGLAMIFDLNMTLKRSLVVKFTHLIQGQHITEDAFTVNESGNFRGSLPLFFWNNILKS